MDYFDRLIREHPQNKWVEGSRYFRAYCKHLMTDYTSARTGFEEFAANYANSVYADEAAYYAAKCYFLAEEYNHALSRLAAYAQVRPESQYADDAYYLIDLADYYPGRKGYYPEAMEHFRRTITCGQ